MFNTILSSWYVLYLHLTDFEIRTSFWKYIFYKIPLSIFLITVYTKLNIYNCNISISLHFAMHVKGLYKMIVESTSARYGLTAWDQMRQKYL